MRASRRPAPVATSMQPTVALLEVVGGDTVQLAGFPPASCPVWCGGGRPGSSSGSAAKPAALLSAADGTPLQGWVGLFDEEEVLDRIGP